jgi:hypothetical protein
VIDAQPGIAGEGVTEILPKGVDALAGIEVTQRIFSFGLQLDETPPCA